MSKLKRWLSILKGPKSQILTLLPGELDALMLQGINLETAFQNNSRIWTMQGREAMDQWVHVILPAGRWERNYVFQCAEVDQNSWSFLEAWYKEQEMIQ